MPAVRKPTATLAASGSFNTHPERRRKGEPDTGRGIGPAPDYLTDQERAIWDEIVADCAPGVFQSSDRAMFGILVRMVAEWRYTPETFGGRKYPVLLALLARCGMTPADRSRVMVPDAKTDEKPKVGLSSFRR